MSTALIIAVGSRGDTEPLLSLAASLLASKRFERVHMCLQRDYVQIVPSHPNLIAHPMPFDMDRIFKIFAPLFFRELLVSFLQRRPMDSLLIQNSCLELFIKKAVFAHLPRLCEIAAAISPDIVIGGILSTVAAQTVAESVQVPLATFNLWPITRTPAYPYLLSDLDSALLAADNISALHKNSPVNDQANLRSYEKLEIGLHQAGLTDLNNFRRQINLKAISAADLTAIYSGLRKDVHVVNAYSSDLIPPRPHWASTVHSVPALADGYIPPGWEAQKQCPKLYEFLSRCEEKPFCVSFGSMRLLDRARSVSRALFTALRKVGIKQVLLLKGDMNLGVHRLSKKDHDLREWAKEHVYFCDESPQYAWLFPQCSGLICHGGAGTTAAALRAGLPLVIAPVVCDQFFWGRLIRNLEIGGAVEPELRDGSIEKFVAALRFAMSDSVRARACAIKERLTKDGSGADRAAELVASLIE